MSEDRIRLRGLPLATLSLAVLLAGCNSQGEQAAVQQEEPAVAVITVKSEPLALSSELPGRVEAMRAAEVRARVAGIVLRRLFEEGADVKAGQVLFQIDPAPLRAALSRAQGQLASTEAALAEAQAIVKRHEPLVAIEAVSQQDFDSAQARMKAAQAARQSARAEVEAAQLNLDYSTVRAPISGRIGRAQVTEGALVGQDSATPMALIQQLDPVYVDFQQPVAEAVRLRAALAEGKLTQHKDKGAPISLTVDGTGQQRDGNLLFSDITVDRDTGQTTLRGKFDNRDGMLLPGMYVQVKVGQGVEPAAILVPQRAVQRGSDSKANVLVVDAQNTVQVRPVQTGAMHGAKWHITQGLQAGERVIVGSMSGAAPGTKVKPEELAVDQPAEPAPGTALSSAADKE